MSKQELLRTRMAFTPVHIKENLPKKIRQLDPEFVDLWNKERVDQLVLLIKEVKQYDYGGVVIVQDPSCGY